MFYRYWGKASPGQESGADYHLLPYHSLDVAAVGYQLLDPDGPYCRALANALGVDPRWLREWFRFCLMLHDLGKFARSFQNLAPDLSPALVSSEPRARYFERHDSLGFLLWKSVLSQRLADLVPVPATQLLPWLAIVCGHHGQPPKESTPNLRGCFADGDEAAAEAFVRAVTERWLPDLTPLASITKTARRQASWQLAGLAVVADWLGSDQQHFSYHPQPMGLDEYWQRFALPGAELALAASEWGARGATRFESIQQLFPFIDRATPLQAYAEGVLLDAGPQLFILEDVTGAGKTEAAMTLVHRLMAAGRAAGVYVGLPTMATANAMYRRMGECYAMLFQPGARASLVLAHGARQLSREFRDSVALVDQPQDRSYEPGEGSASAYCSAWIADSRKKALLADVGVGTLDQALLGVLPARHQSLRLLGLNQKVLLVDEVHSYDPYMRRLLTALLEAHARQGGSAVLLSATLPQEFRRQLVAGFARGRGSEAPPLVADGYPLATHFPAADSPEMTIETRDEVRRTVRIERLDDEPQALTRIEQAVRAGRCVCWVRNTVGDARAAYALLEQADWMAEDRLTLFHSRFAMVDRQALEADVLARFGKDSSADQRCGQVLVATQVVEQSLDLDFDLMLTDLAPVDLVIQRVGRLQRHVRNAEGNRLEGAGINDQRGGALCYLVAPDPERVEGRDWLRRLLPGTQAVYRHVGQLWLSAKVLMANEGFRMPEDARSLIEGVYGTAAQDAIPEPLLDDSWTASGEGRAQQGMAQFNLLKLDQGYCRASADDNSGWDEEVRIPTRLSERAVTVALARLVGDRLRPYADGDQGWALSQLSLPEREWRRVSTLIPPAWAAAVEQLKAQTPALRWVEVLPLVGELADQYSSASGWGE